MIEITTLETVREGLVVLDVYLPNCGPCRLLEPLLRRIEQEQPDVTFMKLDAAAYPELADELKVRSAPTVIFFWNGEEKDRFTGLKSGVAVRELIAAHKY